MRPPRSAILAAAMTPLAALYRLGVGRRNARFDRGVGVVRAAIPVLSVGNLEAGGTGKSPMAALLVEKLRGRGRVPAVVSRGYGGKAGAGPIDVGRGGEPLVGADVAGDEPVMLAASTRAIVVAGSDRIRGVARAAELGADVAILDDGFQHRGLARDLDVVLLDAVSPFGNGRLLPAGPLREPIEELRRADVIVLTRWDERTGPSGRRNVEAAAPQTPTVRAALRRRGFTDSSGNPAGTPGRVVAFCGIARPESFLDGLRAEGIEIASFLPFPDHHRFSAADLGRIEETGRTAGAPLVTTEKDLVRLAGWSAAPRLLALRVALELLDPAPLHAALERVLGTRR